MRLIRLLKNDLAKETALWVEKDLISEQQAKAICQEYGVSYNAQEQNSFLLNVLTALGLIFIGVALIVLIGHNWDSIPRAARMGALLVVTLLTQIQAYRRYVRTGNVVLFLLGNLFYGASIILIAQIYHLGEHMPDGVFWWALGSLPFALFTRSAWLMLFTLFLAIIWYALEASSGFIPILFPLFVVSSWWVLWQGKSSFLLLIASLFSFGLLLDYSFALLVEYFSRSDISTLSVGIFTYSPLEHFSEELVVALSLMLLYNSLALKWSKLKSVKAQDYAVLVRLWVVRFSLILLVAYSFAESWREFLFHNWSGLTPMLFFVVPITLLACWFAYQAQALARTMTLSLVLLLPFVLWRFIPPDNTHELRLVMPLIAQVITNLVAVITTVILIVRGISYGMREYFFLGIFTLIVIAYARYFDMIGSYIGAAILFLVFAFILLGAAQYWKRRMQAQTEQNNS